MNCTDLETLLCDYVDGTLPTDTRSEVERHLSGCASCAELAQDAAAAVEFMGRAAAVEPPPELITRILYALPAARHAGARQPAGLKKFFAHLVQPMLQPRFAMGFAMTILSFSMLGKLAGISPRQLTRDDLNPVRVWRVLDDRVHRAWDRSVKFYESLRLVYEIQNRISEWTEQTRGQKAPAVEERAPAAAGPQAGAPAPGPANAPAPAAAGKLPSAPGSRQTEGTSAGAPRSK